MAIEVSQNTEILEEGRMEGEKNWFYYPSEKSE